MTWLLDFIGPDNLQRIGITAVCIIVLILVVLLAFMILIFWIGPYGPVFHCGPPELKGELGFYKRHGHVLSRKGGGILSPEEIEALPPVLDHVFDVPWFIGLSTRKGHFLVGIIRLVRRTST